MTSILVPCVRLEDIDIALKDCYARFARVVVASRMYSRDTKKDFGLSSVSPQLKDSNCNGHTNGSWLIKPQTLRTYPPELLVGFDADYEKVSAALPRELGTTTDDAKIEQFVTWAHALARRWLPEKVVSRLERFIYDQKEPPVLVIIGLPIDKDLPPTERNAHVKKTGKFLSETWLVGIGRIVGQVLTFAHFRASRPGMGLLVREIYTTADKVSPEGSRELLDFHVDFNQVKPEKFPNIIAFIGVRGDCNKEGKSLLCSHRKLYQMLDPADIQVLRTEKICWASEMGEFSELVIEGPEGSPQFNLFDEIILRKDGFENVVDGIPEAVAAYKRVP